MKFFLDQIELTTAVVNLLIIWEYAIRSRSSGFPLTKSACKLFRSSSSKHYKDKGWI